MNRFTQLTMLLVILLGAWLPMSAQRTVGSNVLVPNSGNISLSSVLNQAGGSRGTTCDTITNIFNIDSAQIFTINGFWGYVSGHNEFGDLAKADSFANTGPAEVTGAFVAFGQADFGNASNTVRVSVWDNDGVGGAPNTRLGFQDITISSFAADVVNGLPTFVNFNTPVAVNGDFYLGIELTYNPGDTVALYITEDPRVAGPINTAWEQWDDLSWNSYPASWGFNTSHWLFPIVCPTSPAPVADFVGTPTTVTAGNSVNFTDLSSGSPTAWSWSFPGGTPSSSTAQSPSGITYNTPGSYDVTLIATSANGADTTTKASYIQVQASGGSNTYVDCDTFTNLDLATATPIIYTSSGAGYVAGHNFFGDSSKAELIGNALPGSPVSGVLMEFTVAEFSSPTASIRVKVWNNNGTGGLPGTVLATETVTISSIAADITAGRLTYVPFTNPATPAGNYYIGISYQYANGDTVALLTSTDGDVVPGTAYEQWSDGTWHNYNEAGSWGYDLGHYVFPIQCATVPCPTISATFTSTAPVCTAANGSATATGTGGTGPYTFVWSNSATTATASGLAAGTYTVTVTDANGCTGTASTTLTATSPTIAPNFTTTPAVCTASNGSATAAPSGGTAPYTYIWSSSETVAAITGKTAGAYTVTITDANGCSVVATATITASSGTLAVNATATQATCTALNGTATAAVTGGTAPFTYAWSNAGTTATISGLAAGAYTVTVTDANGCSATATATVTANSGNLTVSTSTTNATCGAATGSATATPAGGTAPYTYAWSNSGNTATITGLIVGTFDVTVTDANGCSATASASVADPGSPTLTLAGGNDVSCFGLSDGAAAVTAAGGATPYTYLWSTGATGASVSGLPVGPVSVTVTDGNGCQATLSGNINGPSAALSATVALNSNVTCPGASNGSLTVTGAGGTTPYTFAWSTGGITTATAAGLAPGTYTVTVTDANGCSTTASGTVAPPTNPVTASVSGGVTSGCGTATGSATANANNGTAPYSYLWSNSGTSATITGIAAGSYTVTVTDATGCTVSATGTVTDPGAHTASAAVTAITCNGGNNGSVTVTPTGGSGNFTYTWSPNVSSSATATGLSAGSYSITVLDVTTNCTAVTVANVTQPDTIGAQITQTNVTCPGFSNGVASVIATGGNGGYTYNWLTSPAQTTATVSGLSAGSIILQISDSQGCSRNFTVTITQPASIAVTVTKNDVTCNGANNGTATATATGGTGNFTYTWSTTPAQNGATASGLGAGTYTVTATDANGCTSTQSVTITEPTALAASATATAVSCFNGATGSATASATGGNGPYTYAWSTSPIQNGATASNLRAGSFTVTVTDASGCTATATAAVTQPTLISVTTSTTPVNCAGGNDGTATASATGGTGPYTYQWTSGSGATISNLAGGTYTVTVTDDNGCTVTGVATVANASGFSASLNTTPTTCQGTSTGTATVNVTGGVAPFTYAWSASGSGASSTGLPAGTYTVTVTDASGCEAIATGTVGAASGITINATPTGATCNGGNDGGISLSVSGGAGNYTYAWSSGVSTQNLTGVAAGTYSVTVTDGGGCSTSATNLVVGEANAINLTLTTTDETGIDANDGTATATSTGGTGLITYTWSNSATGSNLTNLAPGTYTVTATDGNGCSATASGIVDGFTSISNVGLVVSLNMFPNPSEGKVNMSLTLAQPEAVTVEWYNAIGERVLGTSFESSLTVNHTFDLSNMAAGVYYARINYAGQTNVERVVLNK